MEHMSQLVGMRWHYKFSGYIKDWRPKRRPEEIAEFISTFMRVAAGTASDLPYGMCTEHTADFMTDLKITMMIINGPFAAIIDV